MRRAILTFVFAALAFAQSNPIHVIVFGAHPDDCDIRAAGTAAKFAEIVAATVVGGELAIAAALANGRFIEAHRQNRRRNQRPSA